MSGRGGTPQKLDLAQVDLCLTIALEQSKGAMEKPTRQEVHVLQEKSTHFPLPKNKTKISRQIKLKTNGNYTLVSKVFITTLIPPSKTPFKKIT